MFAEFETLVDDVYQRRKDADEIWSGFRVHSNGLITCDSDGDFAPKTVVTHLVSFTAVIDSLQHYFEIVNTRRTSVSTISAHAFDDTYKQRLQDTFEIDSIIDEICRNSDDDIELSATSYSLQQPSQQQQHMQALLRGSLDDEHAYDRDSLVRQLHSLENTRPLQECHEFHEIVYAYLDHVDTVQQVQLAVIAPDDASPVLPSSSSETYHGAHSHSHSHSHTSGHSSSQQKTFTFSSSDIDAHEMYLNTLNIRLNAHGSHDSHHDGQGLNLAQFAIGTQCVQNPSVLLYDALCVRLDLFDVQCDALLDTNSPANVECELMDIDHEHFLSFSHVQQPISVLSLPPTAHSQFELAQSPMRQLKERGLSAVNHIRSRTQQMMQQMNVRHMNIANFRHTQNAITQKTKQGFNVTKRKFQTVKTKMLEQTRTKSNNKNEKRQKQQHKKIWNMNANKFRRSLDIQRGVGVPMTVTNLHTKTPIDVYQEEHDSFSDDSSAEIEISLLSASPSKGSVATV